MKTSIQSVNDWEQCAFLKSIDLFFIFLPLNYHSNSEYQGVRDGDGEGANRRYILQPLVI